MVIHVWMWSNVGDPLLGRVEILPNLSVNSDCMIIYRISAEINPTLHPPPKVLVSGAFQSYLRDPKCWHNSYIIFRNIFMKKKFQNFFKFFFKFFQFFGHPSQTKRFFSLQNSILLYTWTPKKYL